MEKYVQLIGAEEVGNASRTMRSAAEGMNSAANDIRYSLETHQRFLDDWLNRFQQILESQKNESQTNYQFQ